MITVNNFWKNLLGRNLLNIYLIVSEVKLKYKSMCFLFGRSLHIFTAMRMLLTTTHNFPFGFARSIGAVQAQYKKQKGKNLQNM
jgi:hypothetical protein